MFLEFFESKGHLAMKSFSLIPHNDKSLLLINSGMAPLKPYFTGAEIPPRRRVTTCQKCIRTGDIENVGKTARHGTFFEMLGNFSFGDYFKHEAIAWSWEFLTQVVGLDPNRLYPSIYQDDDEAFDIWNKEIGIPAERIFRFGKEDNFWEHGAGPCGPCSEIYYDRGEKYGCGKPGCTVGCECDRYMEVWNNVFSQFNNDGEGHYTDLIQKNIDTGMGLERLAVVVQDVDSIFDVDTIQALRNKVCEISGKEYEKDHETDVSIRLITDHIRSATFMISDGIMPTNEGRGYVLRRLIRRAARHGRLLGIDGLFLARLSASVIEGSKDGYPELEEKKDFILNVLNNEETQFNKTIDQGLHILSELEEKMQSESKKILDGQDAFKLYDTYGFPLDLTKEILEEKGYGIDEDGFHAAMEEQRERARSSREVTNYMGADATVYDEIDPSVTTEFTGYDHLEDTSKVTVLTTETEIADSLMEGQKGTIFVEKTPFYATMGGQEGDCGIIKGANGVFEVEDTIKLRGGKYGHVGVMKSGMISNGEEVTLQVNEEARKNTEKNHSATHLLQKALKTVLGAHVEQKGSYVDKDTLRFDFSHFQKVTDEELRKVEHMVNEMIRADYPLDEHRDTPIEEAKELGAIALFGEKYGDKVRVVRFGPSAEFCGGIHAKSTGKIGFFKIISESSVAAGIRRIEALTGKACEEAIYGLQDTIVALKGLFNNAKDLEGVIRKYIDEHDALKKDVEKFQAQAVERAKDKLVENAKEINGVKVVTAVLPMEPAAAKDLVFKVREALPENMICVVGSVYNDKPMLSVMFSDDMVKDHGLNAGKMIREAAKLIQGGGGGQPHYAQAGGKNKDGLSAAVDKVVELAQL